MVGMDRADSVAWIARAKAVESGVIARPVMA